MDESLIVILAVLGGVLAGGALVWFLFGRKPKEDSTGLKLLLDQMNELTRTVDLKIGESFKQTQDAVRHQFSESAKIITDVTEKLKCSLGPNRPMLERSYEGLGLGLAMAREAAYRLGGYLEFSYHKTCCFSFVLDLLESELEK